MYDIFLICPVRNATTEQKSKMEEYIQSVKEQGKTIYYPATDTNQNDHIGFRICSDNKNALLNSKEVHIFWDAKSTGSLFDLGMAFAINKELSVINFDEVESTEGKSFSNMIKEWHKNRQ